MSFLSRPSNFDKTTTIDVGRRNRINHLDYEARAIKMASNLQTEPDEQIELLRNEDDPISIIMSSISLIISPFQQLDKQQTAIASLLNTTSKVYSELEEAGKLSIGNTRSSLLLALSGITQADGQQDQELRQNAITLLLQAASKVVESIQKTKKPPQARSQDRECYFNRLPNELKDKIWKLCLPPGRIYEPITYYNYRRYDPRNTLFYQHWAPPKFREINREAREYCMKAGQFRFGHFEDYLGHGSMRSIWFNNELDAIYLSGPLQYWFVNRLQVKNLIIGDALVLDSDDRRAVLTGDLHGCDNLTIAYQPRGAPIDENRGPGREELYATEPVFYAVKDNERVCTEIVDAEDWDEGLLKTWAEHRDELKEIFYEDGPKMRDVTFRAVEVFRKPRIEKEGYHFRRFHRVA
ncbi:hypothetical protein CSIM01_01640 [Colletotrichum simmondsii]|uniref:2EXR domain-containing protein n=1 Tax=Colletotrichum simmondsii TaxID=703756 RepID=A0A135TRS4_9PEZI|nr:hypothetical protein CSIM01_01640 [Colletotrichum simmondsii]